MTQEQIKLDAECYLDKFYRDNYEGRNSIKWAYVNGANSRQPEIDELKVEITDLKTQIDLWKQGKITKTKIMNTEKQLQLVTYEQARRLKELGFDWKTHSYYINLMDVNTCKPTTELINEVLCDWNKYDHRRCSAPTVALALKWMRDEKRIHNSVNFWDVVSPNYEGYYEVNKITDVEERRLEPRAKYSTESFSSYESAESALLDELLTIIENQ